MGVSAAFASAQVWFWFGFFLKSKGLILTDCTTLHSMCSFLISKQCFYHLTGVKYMINACGHSTATLLGCHWTATDSTDLPMNYYY